MALPGISSIPYLRKVFFFTHGIGLMAGAMFPFIAGPFLGPDVPFFSFALMCLLMGYVTGATMYLFVRITLKKQLRLQLLMLRPLTGVSAEGDQTIESLQEVLQHSVNQVELLVQTIFDTIEELAPHHHILSERSTYLAERAIEGLRAATSNREMVVGMEEQHTKIAEQMDALSGRTQNEAASSRELFASLKEMAEAMEHSNTKFLETSASVDEMASSSREVADKAAVVSTSSSGALDDLRKIEQALSAIREGAVSSVEATKTVNEDAQTGLGIMNESIEEMERIEEESHKATDVMQRLVQQTGEVSKIIDVIKDLVSDTELLAFNAAIIAAKAGAEGKGFSVVAGEIRDLAERTTVSAQDIHNIITTIEIDTGEMTTAVETTANRITRGKLLSIETGRALRQIMESSEKSSQTAQKIADQTDEQSTRSNILLENVSESLNSVQSIANAMNEQMTSIQRIQEGTIEMKAAADQIARGMNEQVRANREFDRGLAERENQIQSVNEAVQYQSRNVKKIYDLIANSESRLVQNKEKVEANVQNIGEMDVLAGRLKELAEVFRMYNQQPDMDENSD
jgi:methyl-accepting chemotaxis protein